MLQGKGLLLSLLLILIFLPISAYSEEVSLEERITLLEHKVKQLADREQLLNLGEEYFADYKNADWLNFDNWRNKLRIGMTKAKLRKLFGEATKEDRLSSTLEVLHYGYPIGGTIVLNKSRVISWTEPDPRFFE